MNKAAGKAGEGQCAVRHGTNFKVALNGKSMPDFENYVLLVKKSTKEGITGKIHRPCNTY